MSLSDHNSVSLKNIERMYKIHSLFYDATRWMFLWNRRSAIEKIGLEKGYVVLVVGCGTGYGFGQFLNVVGEKGRVIGVDYSKSMLDTARRKVEKAGWKNVQLVQADAAKYETRGVDAVLYSYSLSMIPEWRESLKNSFKSLKKTGKIVIIDFSEIKIFFLKQLFKWYFSKFGVDTSLPVMEEFRKYFKDVDYEGHFNSYIMRGVKN